MAMNMYVRSRLQTYNCDQSCGAPVEPLMNGHQTDQMTCMSHGHSNLTAEESFGHHNTGKNHQ